MSRETSPPGLYRTLSVSEQQWKCRASCYLGRIHIPHYRGERAVRTSDAGTCHNIRKEAVSWRLKYLSTSHQQTEEKEKSPSRHKLSRQYTLLCHENEIYYFECCWAVKERCKLKSVLCLNGTLWCFITSAKVTLSSMKIQKTHSTQILRFHMKSKFCLEVYFTDQGKGLLMT